MEKGYIKKHFVGDLIRTLLISFLIITMFSVIYDKKVEAERREYVKEQTRIHVEEFEKWKAEQALLSPEERFEDVVMQLDENGVVHSITYDESKIYINLGPIDKNAEQTSLKEAASSVLGVYQMCADDEGLEKKVCLVAIGADLQPIWIVE